MSNIQQLPQQKLELNLAYCVTFVIKPAKKKTKPAENTVYREYCLYVTKPAENIAYRQFWPLPDIFPSTKQPRPA